MGAVWSAGLEGLENRVVEGGIGDGRGLEQGLHVNIVFRTTR